MKKLPSKARVRPLKRSSRVLSPYHTGPHKGAIESLPSVGAMVRPLRSLKRRTSVWLRSFPIAGQSYEVIGHDSLDGEGLLVLKTGENEADYAVVYPDEVNSPRPSDREQRRLAKPESRPITRRDEDAVDEHAVNELELYIENDSSLMGPRSQGESIRTALRRRMAKGTFDLGKSVKAWEYLVESGAKKYVRELGDGPWFKMFPVEVRRRVAENLAKGFANEEAVRSK